MKKKRKVKLTGAYQTNPITQASRKQPQTNVPLPDDTDVQAARKRVDENQK
jgi:hypothetical protein